MGAGGMWLISFAAQFCPGRDDLRLDSCCDLGYAACTVWLCALVNPAHLTLVELVQGIFRKFAISWVFTQLLGVVIECRPCSTVPQLPQKCNPVSSPHTSLFLLRPLVVI